MQQNIEFQTGVIRPVECFKEGWEMIKDEYWMIFAVTLVGMLIAGFIPFGIAVGAMFCGIYFCLLQKMNGRKVEFEGLFKGFNYFGAGLIATLIIIIPSLISVFFLYGSMIAIFVASTDSRGRINEAALPMLIGTFFVEGVIIGLLLGCLHALIMFAYPLIVDKNLGGVDAVKLSVRAVWANLSGVVGLILVEFVLGIIGYLMLGVGLYLVMPIMFAGVLVAYRKVFPSDNFRQTPPPNASWQS